MDVRETIPCFVDGTLSSGRLVASQQAAPAVSTSASSLSQSSSLIAKPQVRTRDMEWANATADVELYEHSDRLLIPNSERRLIRYVADTLDAYWVTRTVMSLSNRTRTLGRVAGSSGTGKSGTMDALDGISEHSAANDTITVSGLEDIFTALELSSFEHPDIAIDRISTPPPASTSGGCVARPVFDAVRLYWVAKRRASGGTPLIPALWQPPSNDSIATGCGGLCSGDVLGDCPLPFIRRDGASYAVVRSEARHCNKRQRQQLESDMAFAAQSLATAMYEREACALDATMMTIYELAALRAEAQQRLYPR